MNKSNTPLAITFVILIVVSGIFKYHLSLFYTFILQESFSLTGISYEYVVSKFIFLSPDGELLYGLGVLLYFPTYLLLHFGLIFALFSDSPKLMKQLMIGLVGLLLSLAFILAFSRYFELELLASETRRLFNVLVGKPLILFLVEGGGLIYQYIDNRVPS